MLSDQTDLQTPSAGARWLAVVGSLVRISYGLCSLLAPEAIVAAKLAPDTSELADPRLTLRAFGGHQLVVGSLTLAAVRSRRMLRHAALLSLSIDSFDVVSAALEQRVRGKHDPTITWGYLISGAGIAAFAGVLCVSLPRRASAHG